MRIGDPVMVFNRKTRQFIDVGMVSDINHYDRIRISNTPGEFYMSGNPTDRNGEFKIEPFCPKRYAHIMEWRYRDMIRALVHAKARRMLDMTETECLALWHQHEEFFK